MSRKSVVLSLALVVLAIPAFAQLNRSFVSVGGSDANPCTPAMPCRSFGVAIAHTNPGGEVLAIDSGGYGPFSVDRSLAILAAPGAYAGITATAGDGIYVNAGASGKLVLRNLYINGLGTGSAGIAVTGSGDETHIENVVISGFANWGILAFFDTRISDVTIRSSGNGITVDNVNSPVQSTINRMAVLDIFDGPSLSSGIGIEAARNAKIVVRDSVAASTAVGFAAYYLGSLTVESSLASGSLVGAQATLGGTLRLSRTVIVDNTTGILNQGSTVQSWLNNTVAGNTTNVNGTVTPVAAN